jgi:hypothetical protein
MALGATQSQWLRPRSFALPNLQISCGKVDPNKFDFRSGLADRVLASSLDEEVFEMSPDKTAMIAVSSGLIAGATASILPRGMAGVALAVHAVKLTLRLALHVQELADQLSPASAGLESDSWGIQVTGITETNARAMIGDFLAERVSQWLPANLFNGKLTMKENFPTETAIY